MWQIGVWEQREGLYELVRELAGDRARVARGEHPALLAGESYDLLVVSPHSIGWAGAAVLYCRTVLLPGAAGPLARSLRADRAACLLALGRLEEAEEELDPRDTLTPSSLDDAHICVAVQRELIRLDGGVVERQELVLPYDGRQPELALVRTGIRLLLGREGAP